VLVVGPDTTVEQTMRLKDLASTVLAPADLGENWTRFYSEVFERQGCAQGPAYVAMYANTTDYAPPHGRDFVVAGDGAE
jgi:hypothetical protein